MPVFINLGNEKSALEILNSLKIKRSNTIDIRIRNSYITQLNKVIGRKVFKNDSLYISSDTLWEIMQPLGRRGSHNYHNLTPQEVYNALRSIKDSDDVSISYDGRYVIVTLAETSDGASIVVIVSPNSQLKDDYEANIIKIVTIYPRKRKSPISRAIK